MCGVLCMLLGAGLSVAGTPDGFSLSGRPGEPAISAGDGVCPVRYVAEGPSEFEPEQPATGAVRYSAVDSEEAMPSEGTADAKPLWLTLGEMNPAERQNAHLNFEAFDSGDMALADRLSQAADLWNGGDTSTAVTLIRTLEDAGRSFAVGISWKAARAPAKMNSTAIGTHGSADNPHLDGHSASGNAFIAMEDTDGGNYWRVYFSSDGGGTWAETYAWTAATGNTIRDIGGAVVGDYFYVTYASVQIPYSARVRRFHASTGASDGTFNTVGWMEAFDSDPNGIVALQLTSNQDDNNIYAYRIDTSLVSDTTNLAPYFGGNDLHISAYRHHVVIVHQYDAGGTLGIKYRVSYNGGDVWGVGTLDTGSNGNCYSPDVTLRRGSGIIIAYQRDLVGDDLMFMRTRTYANTPWSNIVAVTDADLSWGKAVGLEALPDGGPGIIWFSSNDYAHFDQTPIIWRSNFEFGDTMGWN